MEESYIYNSISDKSINSKNIAVIGAGGWGTALALLLNQNQHNILLWTYDKIQQEIIDLHRVNETYLPNVIIPKEIRISSNVEDLDSIKYIVNTVPTQFIENHYLNEKINLENKILINCSKGIENSSLKLINQIFINDLKVDANSYCTLSGPSHAEEVALNKLTAVSIFSQNKVLAKEIQEIFSNNWFRSYTSDDLIGGEIGGALKNVVAIAAGILDGMNFGDNSKAALLTRGLAEISRLGMAMGAQLHTFAGLTGLGDLYVTCSSRHSRNRSFGEQIGMGKTSDEILKNTKKVAEGVYTAKSAYQLSKLLNIEMPITEQVYSIIYENKSPKLAIQDLMNREFKQEHY